jgi:hypothetical protein
MKELYAKKNAVACKRVSENIKVLNLSHFSETLILSYSNNKISEEFEIQKDKKI